MLKSSGLNKNFLLHSVAEANILGIYLSIYKANNCCFFEMQSEQLLYNLYLHIIHILDPQKKT